jgi:hypothetical protein
LRSKAHEFFGFFHGWRERLVDDYVPVGFENRFGV